MDSLIYIIIFIISRSEAVHDNMFTFRLKWNDLKELILVGLLCDQCLNIADSVSVVTVYLKKRPLGKSLKILPAILSKCKIQH